MELKQKRVGSIVTITIDGNIILDGTKTISEYMIPLTKDTEVSDIILDMENVNTIDSSGIGFIVQIYKKLLKEEKRLVLSSLTEKCNDVFALTKLNKILTIVADNKAAMEVLAQS